MDAKFTFCLLLIVFGITAHAAVMDGHGNPVNNYRGKDCSGNEYTLLRGREGGRGGGGGGGG